MPALLRAIHDCISCRGDAMFRKLLASITVMVVGIGFVAADEFTATIKKVEGDNITFAKFTFKDKKFEKGEDTTLPADKNVKVTKGKFNKEDKKFEPGEAIEKGLKNEMFAKLGEKKDKDTEKKDKKGGFGFGGMVARITTSEDGKTITAISVMNFGGGKGKKKTDEKKTDN
jgi:hypothetical protein